MFVVDTANRRAAGRRLLLNYNTFRSPRYILHPYTSYLLPQPSSFPPPTSPLLPHSDSLTPTPSSLLISSLLPHLLYLTSHLLSYPSSPPSSIHPVPSSIILHNSESQTPLSLISHPSCIIPSLTSYPLPHTSSPPLHLMSSLTQYPSSLNTQLSTHNPHPLHLMPYP